jgi:N-methylhydantoinase A
MKGGEEPTVCDANVVLGYLPSDVQLGGKMEINREASEKAVQKVADAMGISLMEAAEGIIKIVNESMFGALRLVSVEQGYDPRDFALVGFGGAGPLHANALGILTQAWPVIVPPGPGVLCAYGDATTQVQDEAARTYLTMAEELTDEQLLVDLRELRERAGESLVADGIPAIRTRSSTRLTCATRARPSRSPWISREEELQHKGIALLTDQFDAEHEQLFTFKLGDGHEILMIRAVAKAASREIIMQTASDTSVTLEDCLFHQSRFYFEGQWHDSPIYWREKLHSELEIARPGHRHGDGLHDGDTARLYGKGRHGRQPADQPPGLRSAS